MHLIKVKDKNYMLASKWEELTEAQLLKIAPIVFCMEPSPENKWKVFLELVPFKGKLIKRLSEDQVYDLVMLVDWIWQQPMNHCPMKEFTFAGKVYLMPEANFSNVVMIEYALADNYLRKFLKKPEDTAPLDSLISTICRPKRPRLEINADWDGDYREKFNSAVCAQSAQVLSHLSIVQKVIILQYFVSCQKTILKTYGAAFTKADPSGEVAKPAEAGQQRRSFDIGYMELIFDLAEQKIFGEWEKTCFTPVPTVFLYLVKKKFDSLQANAS